MTPQIAIIFFYGLFVLIGGVIGHLKVGSFASLLSGVISGSLLMLSAALLYKGIAMGWTLALVVTLALLGFFGYRYFTLFAIWPAGVMSLLSVAMLIFLALYRA